MHAVDKVAGHAQENNEFQTQLRQMEEEILRSSQ